MKSVAMIVVSVLMGALTIAIIMTVQGRMNRNVELQNGLSSIVEETVANMTIDKKYDINSPNEFIADFVSNLSVQLDSDSDILIEIAEKDIENGQLSLRVTEVFAHPNGKPGTVTCERTAILNRIKEPERLQYEIQFVATDGTTYKKYIVYEGNQITVPVNPVREGAQFIGWKDGNGYLADFTQPVEQDRTYFAEWT